MLKKDGVFATCSNCQKSNQQQIMIDTIKGKYKLQTYNIYERELLLMKIFVDDIRKINIDEYSVFKTYEDCIIYLNSFKYEIEIISLDYDLGSTSKYTGYDIIEYMYNNNIVPNHINIHSTHPTGSIKIKEFAENNFPNTIVTTNKILKK